jgi:hypothetical protein
VADRVQDAVDALAGRLGLSLLVEDLRQHPVWWCTVGPVDDVRTRTVLDRQVEQAAADVVREYGLRQATEPVRTPAMPERGMWARWAVPVRHDGRPLGLLWVLDPDDAVTADDLVALTDLGDLAGDELARSRVDATEHRRARDALIARLLAGPDPDAAVQLADLENLPDDPHVQVDLPGRSGDWPLPDGASAHVHRGRHRDATSGAPLPLARLGEAARRATATATALHAGAVLTRPTYDDLGAWLLVVEAPNDLSPGSIHPAADLLAEQQRSDLLDTARVVLDLGGDVAAAAEALHVHRTTLYYRLDRIAELTGVNLREGRARTDLQLALWLHAYRSA